MTSELLALGISYKTAPVALREKLALTQPEADRLVKALVETERLSEAVAISTCNRTEIYVVTEDPVQSESELLSRMARRTGIRPTELASVVYTPRNCDAARHLYRVTSGLESMIVGEAEVQGQVKRAYEAALAAGTTGPMTSRLFTAALQTGKRVRTETELGASRTSVSTTAVDFARDAVGDLRERHVMIIGAGETAELTAQALADRGVASIFVANRHKQRALALADRFGGSVVSLDELPTRLETADIVVSSTSSPHPIVGVEELELVMEARGGRPIVFIDIAVPRDIDPACAELEGVTLCDIDDLQNVVTRNLSVREGERARAEAIVEDEIVRFARWLGQLDVRPTIGALREHGTQVVEQVLAENATRWDTMSPRDLARIDAVARAVMQRLLHEPTIRLKSLQEGEPTHPGSGHARLEIVRELFGLHPGTDAASPREAGDNVRELDEPRRRTAGE